MDDKRLTDLLYEQRPLPSPAFDDRVSRQVNRLLSQKEQPMKKKLSALAIVVMALLALTLAGALAEWMGLNLFEVFGKQDKRLEQLAPQAVLQEASPVSVSDPDLGEVKAGINSAYYDGQTLLVAYAVQNGLRMEPWTPAPGELAGMDRAEAPDTLAVWDPAAEALVIQWNQAVEQGKPFGFVTHAIGPGDHTSTDTGIDLPPDNDGQVTGEDGVQYHIREYVSPLPPQALDQDALRIEIGLHQFTTHRYFDGTHAYVSSQGKALAPMRATVWRAQAAIHRFEGTGTWDGQPVMASATVSAAAAEASVQLMQGSFPALEGDTWYELHLTDEQGRAFRAKGGETGGQQRITIPFDGIGTVPQALTLRIIRSSEAAEPVASEPIALTLIPQDIPRR